MIGLPYRPVIVEVPHFASLRGGEREITVRRSDGGRVWKDTTSPRNTESELDRRKAVLEVLKAIDTGAKCCCNTNYTGVVILLIIINSGVTQLMTFETGIT